MTICRPLPHLIAEIPSDIREQLSDFLSAEIMRSRLDGPLERAPTPFEQGLSTLVKSLGLRMVEIRATSD
jgi:hypothetical protein